MVQIKSMGHSKNNETYVLQNGQNIFPACNIFELPHYFLNDPYGFSSSDFLTSLNFGPVKDRQKALHVSQVYFARVA